MPRLIISALLSCCAALACSDLPELPIGQLRLGLASGIGESRFRLEQATFVISGSAQVELSSDDSPDGDSLQRALPLGDYSAELLPGWQLARGGAAGSQPVAAELVSSNPLDFTIRTGELTTVTYQFRTTGDTPVAGGGGEVRVAIEVDGQGAPRLLFSELMKNPQILPDADGEWLELYNGGTQPMELTGCELRRDEQTLPLDGGFTIAPGAYLTFANGDAPGFTPDVLYSGITLPNSGAFTLAVACGGEVLDQVLIESAALPNAAGHSLSLSRGALDPAANDRPASWCDGVSSYNGDFGTPGEGNPDCP
jgi:hypothetical protein